ncbi:hypothetical protein [Caenispirillum bisanense]|uniref:hypothetical protein n=1 Tax=Caenispirillum bisanense TaxID=414052 RepID=UPI000BE2D757|nr:hypothetical protein [Caenispirillum bisanense]
MQLRDVPWTGARRVVKAFLQVCWRFVTLASVKVTVQLVTLCLAFLGPLLTVQAWPFTSKFWRLATLLNEKEQFGQMILAVVPLLCVSFTNVVNHALAVHSVGGRRRMGYLGLGLAMLVMLVFLVFLLAMLGMANNKLDAEDLQAARSLVGWAIAMGFLIEFTLSWLEATPIIKSATGEDTSRRPLPDGAGGRSQ